jgi:hypothetical protein
VPESQPVVARRRCRSAFLGGGALAVAVIVSGGGLAHAAESESGGPATVSVSWTDPDGQPVGPGGAPVTTTTTVASGTGDGTASSDSVGVSVGGASDGASASLDQTISVSILPGPMTVSPASESVAFSQTHGQGQGRGGPYRGSVAPVTVVDARGTLVGWNATVTLLSVAGLDGAQLAHARLCVSSDPVTVVAGNPPEVRSGTRSCGSVGDPLTLFYAPPNGGGGTFSDTGALSLWLPGTAAGNQVTASLSVEVH